MSKRRKRPSRAKSPAPIRPSTATPPDPHLAELDPALENRLVPHPLEPPARPSPPLLIQRHRLAPSEIGRGGSHGNPPDVRDLLATAASLVELQPVASEEPTTLRAAAREYRALTKQAIELENAAAELREAERQAAVARRRIERAQRAAERAAHREARREVGGLYAGESRSANRPVHVEVAPGAWGTVKADAIGRRQAVGAVVGQLVTAAGDRPLPGHQSPHRAPSGGRRAQRFARLFLNDADWARFRARAVDANLTAARAVGVVVEIEAQRLGWRPGDDR